MFFSLGIVGVDGLGEFSLKMSEVGLWDQCGVVVEKVLRVWWRTPRKSLGLGKCSQTWVVIMVGYG